MTPQQQLLSQLKDIHTPKAISMWPATFAWYVTFVVLLVIMAYLIVRVFQYYFKKRRQQHSLNLLNEAVRAYQFDPAAALASISILLRRVALAKYNRLDVASLTNTAWLKFLDNEIQTTEFSNGIGQVLLHAPYQKQVDINIDRLAYLVERWIRSIL